MNLKLKAALSTLFLFATMILGAVIAHFAIITFGFMNVAYFAGGAFLGAALYALYSIKLGQLESLEKLNAGR